MENMRRLIAGNWKMNNLAARAEQLVQAIDNHSKSIIEDNIKKKDNIINKDILNDEKSIIIDIEKDIKKKDDIINNKE